MSRRTATALLLIAIGPAWLGGCAGYTTASQYPENVKTVAVNIWTVDDTVYRRELEFRVTEAVAKQIELDTPYKVVDESLADTVLKGRIVSVDQRVLSYEPDQAVPRDMEVRMVVEFTWTDQRTGKNLTVKKNFPVAGVYYLHEPMNEDFFEGSADAINRLAERVVESMEKPW